MVTIAFAAGGLGLAYGAWSRYYLWRWSKECRGTRIAIAYKRKVKVDAPLTEWMLWARQAAKDKERQGPGRVLYSGSGTTVMVVQRIKARTAWKMRVHRWASKSGSGQPSSGIRSKSQGHASSVSSGTPTGTPPSSGSTPAPG